MQKIIIIWMHTSGSAFVTYVFLFRLPGSLKGKKPGQMMKWNGTWMAIYVGAQDTDPLFTDSNSLSQQIRFFLAE